ncbi:MAG: hypothetical protein LW878_11560 [Proteobacteria bacterium]|jgi:hypothetical protein|nr:hypothetical protein [Pseudomonadota bacterium]
MLNEIESKLSPLGSPLILKRSFISCYGRQVLTHALWLVQGEIVVEQPRKSTVTHSTPGLYFYDDFFSGQIVPYKIEVSADSQIFILTKSEFALLGLALPA